MIPTIYRRIRRHVTANETTVARKESRQNQAFFGGSQHEAFFKPDRAFAIGQVIQPKCADCEKEDKKVNPKMEEEEKVQKKEKRGAEEEDIQMKGEEEEEKIQKQEAAPGEEEEMASTPTFSEKGVEEQNTRHFANCEGVTVQGHTDANYGNSYTAPGTSSRGSSCTECSGDDCITNTGTVISVFTANPQITLPPVPTGLNECEQNAVQNFINTTLRAHEQQHVAAFNTYRGTVRTGYTYRGCASGLDAYTQQIHDNIESARKTRSDAASAALDANGANIFNVTCECPDPEPEGENE